MTHSSAKLQQISPTWDSYIRTGNDYFNQGNYAISQAQYTQALTLGSHLLQIAVQQEHAPETIHLFIISCFNMANVHEELGQKTEAETLLRQAYDKATDLMTCQTLSLAFRATIYQGFQAAFERLMAFYHQYGDRQSCDALISQAQPLALAFLSSLESSEKG
jgi:tetratricopeptide (TPR) repeat protein